MADLKHQETNLVPCNFVNIEPNRCSRNCCCEYKSVYRRYIIFNVMHKLPYAIADSQNLRRSQRESLPSDSIKVKWDWFADTFMLI